MEAKEFKKFCKNELKGRFSAFSHENPNIVFKKIGEPEWIRVLDAIRFLHGQVEIMSRKYQNLNNLKEIVPFVENIFWNYMKKKLYAFFTKEQMETFADRIYGKVLHWPDWTVFGKQIPSAKGVEKFWKEMYEIFIHEPVERETAIYSEKEIKEMEKFFNQDIDYVNFKVGVSDIFNNGIMDALEHACQVENQVFGSNVLLKKLLKRTKKIVIKAMNELYDISVV